MSPQLQYRCFSTVVRNFLSALTSLDIVSIEDVEDIYK